MHRPAFRSSTLLFALALFAAACGETPAPVAPSAPAQDVESTGDGTEQPTADASPEPGPTEHAAEPTDAAATAAPLPLVYYEINPH